MALTLPDILDLFARRGAEQYDGEPVTQIEHALQSALLAEQAGADAELISAALLHDIGHLLHDFGPTPTSHGVDDVHQYRCLPFLRPLFGAAVLEPIKLHVDAKRYLCAVESDYLASLSADSRRSLALQGGVFEAGQAAGFIAQPHAEAAVRLRRWDDLAKRADFATPDFAYFASYLQQAAQLHAAAESRRDLANGSDNDSANGAANGATSNSANPAV
jgi:phosphonate degradation associated HDIG domain protein